MIDLEYDAEESPDNERNADLEFLREMRESDLARLHQIRTNLSFGGPRWQVVAVERAICAREARLT